MNNCVKRRLERIAVGSGNSDKINFGFYVRENGCGSGLYYGKELDSSPTF